MPFLLLLVGSLFIFSCKDDDDDYVDNDTYSVVYDYSGVNFTYNDNDGWNYYRTLPVTMYNTDVMLIFMQTDTTTTGSPVWTPIPAKFNPVVNGTSQEVYYDNDFSISDFKIYVRGTFDLQMMASTFLNNKNFRVVLVPANYSNKTDLRKLSYEEVTAKYNIDDSKVVKL
ncbi:hypothetical protein [Epilithonimonas vandammei]|uniref:hypothetical protein n=1 Tax=Epilithonimonas vandammei TaxID=2487072 RepID=UPI0028A2371E|nr:hypothetical protein [Epilithonimonas vandammei]